MSVPEPVRLRRAAEALARASFPVALTGAGISVDSGIPAFRGSQGLWERFDPMEYATIGAFLRDPEKVWRMLSEMMGILAAARPNPGHLALARLEGEGRLRSVITQNIDGLHQAAGSRRVIEYHGNPDELLCLSCWKRYESRGKIAEGIPPRCACGEILKPDIVLFGEPIPWRPQEEAEREAGSCDLLLVIGTSAQVTPACDIPRIAKRAGATVVEINPEETPLTGTVASFHLAGSASRILPELERLSKSSDLP